jgi:hypothetical protein
MRLIGCCRICDVEQEDLRKVPNYTDFAFTKYITLPELNMRLVHGQTDMPKIFPMSMNQSFPSSHLNMATKPGNDLAKVQPYIQV